VKLAAKELLTTQRGPGDDLWHARYPTATRTLCDKPAIVHLGRKWAPTCEPCVDTARAFDRIDGSCPPHWGWDSEVAA